MGESAKDATLLYPERGPITMVLPSCPAVGRAKAWSMPPGSHAPTGQQSVAQANGLGSKAKRVVLKGRRKNGPIPLANSGAIVTSDRRGIEAGRAHPRLTFGPSGLPPSRTAPRPLAWANGFSTFGASGGDWKPTFSNLPLRPSKWSTSRPGMQPQETCGDVRSKCPCIGPSGPTTEDNHPWGCAGCAPG